MEAKTKLEFNITAKEAKVIKDFYNEISVFEEKIRFDNEDTRDLLDTIVFAIENNATKGCMFTNEDSIKIEINIEESEE